MRVLIVQFFHPTSPPYGATPGRSETSGVDLPKCNGIPRRPAGSKLRLKWYRIWKITGTWLWRIIAWLHKHGLSTDVKWFKHLTLTKRRSEDEFFRGPASLQNRVLSFCSRPGGGRTTKKRSLTTRTRTVFPSRDEIMLTGVYNNEIPITDSKVDCF